MKTLMALLSLVAILATCTWASAAPVVFPQIGGYVAVDLHQTTMPMEAWSSATSVNDWGEIVLQSMSTSYVTWMGYGAQPFESPDGFSIYAERINNDGACVGTVMADDNSWWYGAVWNWMGECTVHESFKFLADINNNGIAVGLAESPSTVRVVDTNTGAWRDVSMGNHLGGFPMGINNMGVACGYAYTMTYCDPCVWMPDGRLVVLPRPTDVPDGGWANDVNDNNVVVGGVWTPSKRDQAVIWQNGVVRYLASLGGESRVDAINAANIAVGMATDTVSRQFPVVWRNNQIAKLPLLRGFRGGWAHDINRQGWIVGYCWDSGWNSHATLWIPIGPSRR